MNGETQAVAQNECDEDVGTQYLTFLLAGEQYGLNILQVQEIRGWEQVTRIPNAPDFVKGVINLRGTIVPVVDLRQRFGLPVVTYTPETVVIIVRTVSRGADERSLGVVVDAVSDVLVAQDERVINTPDFGVHVPTENILGIVAENGQMVMLLDVATLLDPADDPLQGSA